MFNFCFCCFSYVILCYCLHSKPHFQRSVRLLGLPCRETPGLLGFSFVVPEKQRRLRQQTQMHQHGGIHEMPRLSNWVRQRRGEGVQRFVYPLVHLTPAPSPSPLTRAFTHTHTHASDMTPLLSHGKVAFGLQLCNFAEQGDTYIDG